MNVIEQKVFNLRLNKLFDEYSESTARSILIECITSELRDNFMEPEKKTKTMSTLAPIKNIPKVCEICYSTDFQISNSQEICRNCGVIIRNILQSRPTFNKEEQYVKMSQGNKLKTTIDGKTVNIDLNKLMLYSLDKLTPQQQMFRNGAKNIESKIEDIVTKDQLDTTLGMYHNITVFYDNNPGIKPSIRPSKNKLIYQALCSYYGSNKKINIYTIIELFDVELSGLELFNKLLFEIFKNTEYINILDKTIAPEDFKTNISNKDVSERVDKLLSSISGLFKEMTKEVYAAAVLYINKNVLKNKTTVVSIQTELNVPNTQKIMLNYNKITNYLSRNPKIKIS